MLLLKYGIQKQHSVPGHLTDMVIMLKHFHMHLKLKCLLQLDWILISSFYFNILIFFFSLFNHVSFDPYLNIFVWDLQQCTAPVVALSVTSSPSLSCSSGFRNNVAPVGE